MAVLIAFQQIQKMAKWIIKKSSFDDINHVINLLNKSNLPYQDIDAHFEHFIVARDDKNVVGVVGLENCNESGLLRSLAVDVEYRNEGLGIELVSEMVSYARSIGIQTLYLLTTTADGFFKKIGFQIIDRNYIPAEIKSTNELRCICPVSAICMKKGI